MSIQEELNEFRKQITDNFDREKVKDMIMDLDIELSGIKSEIANIMANNQRGILDKKVDWQREWALMKGKMFVAEQKKEIILMQEYSLRKLDEVDKPLL